MLLVGDKGATLVLLLILCSVLATLPNIGIVEASGTIYIRADGTVEGTDKIQRNGNVYTLTDNIYDSIVVQKDNIVVDGAGYTLQGNGNYIGIHLQERNSITVRNVRIRGFSTGIMLWGSSNTIIGNTITNNDNGVDIPPHSNYNTVSGNSITNNNDFGIRLGYLADNNNIHGNNIVNNANGIWLWRSSNYNTISGNNIMNSDYGIKLEDSSNNNAIYENTIVNNANGIILAPSSTTSLAPPSNNNIHRNNIANNDVGIKLKDSPNNNIHGNNITDNKDFGILLHDSPNNTIYENNIIANNQGIHLSGGWPTYAPNNKIFGNNVTKNGVGISFFSTSNSVLKNNNMVDNEQNFFVTGLELSHFIHVVDTSNTVNGKPMYYWVNERDKTVPSNAGYVALINCKNVTVQNLELANDVQGVLLTYTTNSTIAKNIMTNSGVGIRLDHSSRNTIDANTITNNGCGIEFVESSSNNIHGNYIVNNSKGIYLYFAPNNTIFENLIEDNHIGLSFFSIYISSSGNLIYNNNLINNTQQVDFSYVLFGGDAANIWDSGEIGNYWSNYNGTDTNHDGIGDTPYIINDYNQDNYPLVNPVVIPEFPDTTPHTSESFPTTWIVAATVIIAVVGTALLIYFRRSKNTGKIKK